jgi:hypothetical protein
VTLSREKPPGCFRTSAPSGGDWWVRAPPECARCPHQCKSYDRFFHGEELFLLSVAMIAEQKDKMQIFFHVLLMLMDHMFIN